MNKATRTEKAVCVPQRLKVKLVTTDPEAVAAITWDGFDVAIILKGHVADENWPNPEIHGLLVCANEAISQIVETQTDKPRRSVAPVGSFPTFTVGDGFLILLTSLQNRLQFLPDWLQKAEVVDRTRYRYPTILLKESPDWVERKYPHIDWVGSTGVGLPNQYEIIFCENDESGNMPNERNVFSSLMGAAGIIISAYHAGKVSQDDCRTLACEISQLTF